MQFQLPVTLGSTYNTFFRIREDL